MVESFAYLFLGDDQESKKKKVDAIKSNYLDKGLKDIDFEVLYSDTKGLTPPKLNEILSYSPSSSSKKRIVFIRRIKSLRKDNRDALIGYLRKPLKSLLLLLDAEGLSSEDSFVKELSPFVKKIHSKQADKLDAFDLTRAIVAHNTSSAVRILNTLLGNRQKIQNILGALIWQWENFKDRLSLEKFREGLKLILNTDLNIKTGRLKEGLALEMLVIRLSFLT